MNRNILVLLNFALGLFIFTGSCKKETTEPERSANDTIQPPAEKDTFFVTNTTTPGVLRDSSLTSFRIAADIPGGIRNLKITLVSGTYSDILLDSNFTDSTLSSHLFDYAYRLKRYPDSKVSILFKIAPYKKAAITKTVSFSYFNKIYFAGYQSLYKAGPGYSIRGINLLDFKEYEDDANMSIAYKDNTPDKLYPIMSSGNGTTFMRIWAPAESDSLVTVDMIREAISSDNFSPKITINSQDMWVVAKLPYNAVKPWVVLKVYRYKTYSQNPSGTSWFRGDIDMKALDYPVNY